MIRQRRSRAVGAVVIVLAIAAAALVADRASAVNYHIERIASGLNQPTYVTQAPNDPANILYYTERTRDANPGFNANNAMGRVWRYDVNTRTKTLVLDLSSRSVLQDTGLQTIAFHPDFNTPAASGFGKMYVSSSTPNGTALNRVEEFDVSLSGPTPTYAATLNRTILQYQNNTQLNHTINWVGFNPTATGTERNYLYISTGDGSYGNGYNDGTSPTGRPSQNPSDLAGKMLRVDVAGADAYPADPLKNFAIPTTNSIPAYNTAHPGTPLMGSVRVGGVATPAPALGEVYITGLRNVYRASFDRANGDLWMGDVGETKLEEVDFLKAGSNTTGPPIDFGWPGREGTTTGISLAPATNPFTGVTPLDPLQVVTRAPTGDAVIGGYVYRGPVAELQGKYFFSDFVGTGNANQLWSLEFDRNTSSASFNGNNGTRTDISGFWQSLVKDPTDPLYAPDSTTASSAGLDHIVSFGEDNAGNLYLVDFGNGSAFPGQYPGPGLGEIFRVTPNLLITVTVDRGSGLMTFANQTGVPIDVRSYSLISAAGAIDRAELTPITGRLDAPPGGDGTIDPTNDWQIMSPAESHTLFSEASVGTAANLGTDESFELSPEGGWIQSIFEDLNLTVTLGDGTVEFATVNFIGNDGVPFERSDLDFDGMLDPGDWNVFRAHHLTSLAGLSKAESYGLGDLDGDGDNDFFDFRLFQADYVNDNGAAAFERLLAVPEPASILLLLPAVILWSCRRSRGRFRRPQWLAVVVVGGLCLLASGAEAALVRKYTFNNGTANDSIGTAHGTLQGNAAVSLGALDLSGNSGDFVSLPATTINITSFTDATFEAWFMHRGGEPWQRVFEFGRSQSDLGRDNVFYTPNSGSGDQRASFRDSTFPENIALSAPAATQNVMHHVAVVIDDDANTGTNQMSLYLDGVFRDDVALSYSFSDFNTTNRLAYLGRSLFTNDPYFNGTIDEFRIHDSALTAQQVNQSYVAGPDPFNLLQLEVNTFTGAVAIKNQHSQPLKFDYYRIGSPEGTLAPESWSSLDDQNVGAVGSGAGESWDEFGSPTAHEVAELFLEDASTLASNGSLDLGVLFDTSVRGKRHDGDLVFQYALQGENQLRQGTINYITPPPLPGDYNDNGLVDAADYTVWRDHLNTPFQLTNEVAGASDGSVTLADYTAWKQRFGNALFGSGAGGAALTIPEPTGMCLLLISLAWPMGEFRRPGGQARK